MSTVLSEVLSASDQPITGQKGVKRKEEGAEGEEEADKRH